MNTKLCTADYDCSICCLTDKFTTDTLLGCALYLSNLAHLLGIADPEADMVEMNELAGLWRFSFVSEGSLQIQ